MHWAGTPKNSFLVGVQPRIERMDFGLRSSTINGRIASGAFRIGLAAGAMAVKAEIRFDGDSKFPVGRMASLCGAGGNVAALGASRMARALPL